MNRLTLKHKKFVSEYIKTLDGELSAKKAGFSPKNRRAFAIDLLQQDFIIQEIKRQLNLQISNLNIQKGYVVQKLLQIAEFSLVEEDILDKDGNYTGKRKLRDSSAGLKALEGLCKHLGFNQPSSDNVGSRVKIITIANLDDRKI